MSSLERCTELGVAPGDIDKSEGSELLSYHVITLRGNDLVTYGSAINWIPQRLFVVASYDRRKPNGATARPGC
jgi:hypothetical protein